MLKKQSFNKALLPAKVVLGVLGRRPLTNGGDPNWDDPLR